MATLFWTQCNPKIARDTTTKKYFGRYLYKIVLYCPGGRIVDGKRSVADELEHRRMVNQHITQSWWHERQNRDLAQADVDLLTQIRILRLLKTPGTMMRIEEPRVQIYAETEDILINLVTDHLQPFVTKIESVAGPADAVAEQILNSGAIIRKKDNGYRYKVIIRDGKYSADLKANVYSYLQNIGSDLVKIPASGVTMLNRTTSYVWNLYFYTNDPSVVTFLNLMHPGLVSNIHELVTE